MDDKQNLSTENWLEKIGIVRDIGEIKMELVRMNAMISKVTDGMSEHHRALYGDGFEKPGIDKTVDRLNEIEKNKRAHFLIIYGSIIGLVTERIWHLITGR